MTKRYTTKAIILQGRNYGESDRIMVAFTKEQGRVDFFARGVRKMNSKNRALVQPFTYSELEFYKGRGLDVLTQGVLIESFSQLHSDFDRIMQCSYLSEYLMQVLEPHDPYVALCYQLLLTFNYLDKRTPQTTLPQIAFLIKSFSLLGYSPQLDACGVCGVAATEAAGLRYVPSEGTLCCERCAGGQGFFVDAGLIHLYRALLAHDLRQDASHLEQDPALLARLEALTERMMVQILEREHRSTSFLRKLKKLRI